MNFQADDGEPNIPMLKWEFGYVMFWAISIVMSKAGFPYGSRLGAPLRRRPLPPRPSSAAAWNREGRGGGSRVAAYSAHLVFGRLGELSEPERWNRLRAPGTLVVVRGLNEEQSISEGTFRIFLSPGMAEN